MTYPTPPGQGNTPGQYHGAQGTQGFAQPSGNQPPPRYPGYGQHPYPYGYPAGHQGSGSSGGPAHSKPRRRRRAILWGGITGSVVGFAITFTITGLLLPGFLVTDAWHTNYIKSKVAWSDAKSTINEFIAAVNADNKERALELACYDLTYNVKEKIEKQLSDADHIRKLENTLHAVDEYVIKVRVHSRRVGEQGDIKVRNPLVGGERAGYCVIEYQIGY